MPQFTAPNTTQETPQARAQAETDGNASVTATKSFTTPTPAAIATSFNREDFTVQSGSTSWTLGLHAPSLASNQEGAARSPLIDLGFNSRLDAQRQNSPNLLGLPSLYSSSSTESLKAKLAEPLILERGNAFNDALRDLGVTEWSGRASFIPDKEYAQFGFLRDQESQVIRFNRDGTASYTIKGADYLSEFTNWVSQGEVKVASATVLYDGKRVSLSPALTYETPLGFSATVASGFDQISSQSYNLTPEFDHLFSGTPATMAQSNDPLNGSLFVNSYKTPQGLLSTVDLSFSDLSSLSLVLGNDGSKNVLAVRGLSTIELFGEPAKLQLDGMYLHGRQDSVNSEAIAGVGTLTRDTNSNRMFLKVSGFGVSNETGVGKSWSTGASVLLEIMRK
jgi:hypothetical protein